MALTRKMLKAMGIEEEKIDEIIEAHRDVTDALKEERDKYKVDAEALADIQKQYDDLKKEVESKEDDPYKEKYEKEHKAFEDYKKAQDAEALQRKKKSAYKEILKEAGIQDKRIDAVLKVSGEVINKIELDDDGKVKGADELTKAAAKEWPEFIAKEETRGTDTQSHEGATGSGVSKADIMKIKDAAERQKAIAENHELFGF